MLTRHAEILGDFRYDNEPLSDRLGSTLQNARDRATQTAHVRFSHAGHVDATAANDVDRVFASQLVDLYRS